jgi:hypothetical protein
MKALIDWTHLVAAAWRRELFEFIRSRMGLSRRKLWDLVAEIRRTEPGWQDDTILLEIARENGIEIPKRIWDLWREVVSHADEIRVFKITPDRKRKGRRSLGRRPEPDGFKSRVMAGNPRADEAMIRGKGEGMSSRPDEARHCCSCGTRRQTQRQPDRDIGRGLRRA